MTQLQSQITGSLAKASQPTAARRPATFARRRFLKATALVAAAISLGGLAAPVDAADDGGGEFAQSGSGRVNNNIVLMDSATTISIKSPTLDPAVNGAQYVRWAPLIQIYMGNERWADMPFTYTYSSWKLTQFGTYGLLAPTWPNATATILPPGSPRGTYLIRAGYYAQWYYSNGAIATKRSINRETLLYQAVPYWGHPSHLTAFLTYIVN